MKINFSHAVPFTPEWNENKSLPEKDQLKFELKPMLLGDLVDCGDTLSSSQLTPEEVAAAVKETGSPSSEQRTKLKNKLDAIKTYVLEYAKIVSGNDGFTLEDVVSYGQFAELAQEVITKLIEISAPNQADVKNS